MRTRTLLGSISYLKTDAAIACLVALTKGPSLRLPKIQTRFATVTTAQAAPVLILNAQFQIGFARPLVAMPIRVRVHTSQLLDALHLTRGKEFPRQIWLA